MKMKNSITIPISFLLVTFMVFGQQKSKEQLAIIKEATNIVAQAGNQLNQGEFEEAEVNYRKAIAIAPSEEVGKYNLGNAYYNKAKNDEAMTRFKQAAALAKTKPEKHRAFHNLGNTLMNAKQYEGAVEAYKNALRNNPNDEETRYNFALAKEMLEKNPPQGGDGDNQNKDQKDKDNQENKDNKDQKDKEGGDKEQKEDNKDKGDNKDQNKGDNEGDNKNDKPKENKDGEGEKPKQPQQGQMSPQQIKNLLEAMNNEEKKVQDKVNVQKQKGAKVKTNKDW